VAEKRKGTPGKVKTYGGNDFERGKFQVWNERVRE